MPFTSYFFKPLPCVCCYLRNCCCDGVPVLVVDSANTHRASPATGASIAGLQIDRDGLQIDRDGLPVSRWRKRNVA